LDLAARSRQHGKPSFAATCSVSANTMLHSFNPQRAAVTSKLPTNQVQA
jgi:hypothetical protein